MFHGHLDRFQKPPLGGKPNTKRGDRGAPNAHHHWFIQYYHVWGPAWIAIHWHSIRLRVRSHMTSHYTWRSLITLHDFGGVLEQPLDRFFWALTISWSRLLGRVWSGPWTEWSGWRFDSQLWHPLSTWRKNSARVHAPHAFQKGEKRGKERQRGMPAGNDFCLAAFKVCKIGH